MNAYNQPLQFWRLNQSLSPAEAQSCAGSLARRVDNERGGLGSRCDLRPGRQPRVTFLKEMVSQAPFVSMIGVQKIADGHVLWGGASPVPGTNLNELLRSLSEFAALLPALILRMLLTSPYQQDRLRPFFRGFCQDFV
jgi:hypothetical protein